VCKLTKTQARCDGQIQVLVDMLGLTSRVSRFVRKFADLGAPPEQAIAAYAPAVEGPSEQRTRLNTR
jgi:3-methyl-2-oxobutanoate hydroxymethyltransferase